MQYLDKEVESHLPDPVYDSDFYSLQGGSSFDIPPAPSGDAASGSAFPADPSSVHPQETSVHDNWESPYRSFLIKGMKKAVDRAELVYRLTDIQHGRNRLEQFTACRSSAWFVRHDDTHEVRVASKRCGLRWCPLCIKTRKFIISNQVAGWLKTLDRPKFFTLTLKHSDDPLYDQIGRLYQCFRNLRRWPAWKKHVRGGVWFFQVKRSDRDNRWHPHIHIAVDGGYFSQTYLSEMWLTVTGNSSIVDVRPIHDSKKAADYVARYSAAPCKLTDLDTISAVEVFDAMHGRRIVGKFGSAANLQLSPKKPDDWAKWTDLHGFGYVSSHRDVDPVCAEIWESWRSGRACTYEPPWKSQRDIFRHDQDQAEPEPDPQQWLFV